MLYKEMLVNLAENNLGNFPSAMPMVKFYDPKYKGKETHVAGISIVHCPL